MYLPSADTTALESWINFKPNTPVNEGVAKFVAWYRQFYGYKKSALFPEVNQCTVAVIGLGYVGLPLAVVFATPGCCVRMGTPLKRRVIGFDINGQFDELRQGIDSTNETSADELQARSCWNSPAIRPSSRKQMSMWSLCQRQSTLPNVQT